MQWTIQWHLIGFSSLRITKYLLKLIPWSKVLLEKLKVSHLVNKIPAFVPLSWTRLIPWASSKPTYLHTYLLHRADQASFFGSHFNITLIQLPTRHSEHFYSLIKYSPMTGSTSLKTLISFNRNIIQGFICHCGKLTSLGRQVCVARNYRLEGKRIVIRINNHPCVIMSLTSAFITNHIHTPPSRQVRGLLEKYPTVFFYANTWWIIIYRACMSRPWTLVRMRDFFPACR